MTLWDLNRLLRCDMDNIVLAFDSRLTSSVVRKLMAEEPILGLLRDDGYTDDDCECRNIFSTQHRSSHRSQHPSSTSPTASNIATTYGKKKIKTTNKSNTKPCKKSFAALHAVINTPELLENILLRVPMKDLLLSQRVNKQFKATIDGSGELQQALFFQLALDDGTNCGDHGGNAGGLAVSDLEREHFHKTEDMLADGVKPVSEVLDASWKQAEKCGVFDDDARDDDMAEGEGRRGRLS
ncbi:hypothetical protein DOTSEDRAFT_56035 [Dothistroma septosporum NZE10]|uniref:F-box domain-containing protein n=1 Tax=Dothistroma septosporum (strain NZE10 / CBS 128990) TaxID=675120 RepID=N1PFT1_DOTSN|nr:hypothetical protein DOTSEDRAFT_56035 [Dothistroma septosporum NZE10]